MDFRNWLRWSAARKHFTQSKEIVSRTSRPWQHKNWYMFEKTKKTGCERSVFSCIFRKNSRCLCSNMYERNWSVSISIIISKSIVVPLNTHSIPQLELLVVILRMNLCQVVSKVLDDHVMKKSIFWRDDTNVLYWVKNPSRKLKPFAGNRIDEIQQKQNLLSGVFTNWRINSADNE